MRRFIALAGTILLLSACGGKKYEPIPVGLAWEAATMPAASALPARHAARGAQSLALIDQYYAGIGKRIGAYTPTTFKIPINEAALVTSQEIPGSTSLNDAAVYLFGPMALASGGDASNVFQDWINIDPSKVYADFSRGSASVMPTVDVTPALYDSLFIDICGGNFPLNAITAWAPEHDIEVVLPGYTDSELPDIPSESYNGVDFGRYDRKYLGANTFRFAWKKLNPEIVIAIGEGWQIWGLNYLIFNAERSATDLVILGYDGVTGQWDETSNAYMLHLAAYTTNPVIGSNWTNSPLLVSPFSAMNLQGMTEATYTIRLDLEDMIEVWDNGTENDPTDDIAVFANGFWNRFSVTVE